MQRAALLYMAMGVRTVTIRAEQIGKYAWSTLGFGFDGPATRDAVNVAVREFAAELDVFDAEIPPFTQPWDLTRMFVDDQGDEVEVLAERLDEVLVERDGPLSPPITEDLPASKALLLYADYDFWDGVLVLDGDDPGFRILWDQVEW